MEFKNDFFEIRLESIGGLGANLAAKILGECGALYLGFNASSFSGCGSEKRGAAVKSFIRYSKNDLPIKINSPIEKPDILCIFHDRLADKQMLMAGVDENTSVIVNTSQTDIQKVRDSIKMYAGTLYVIDALKIATELKTKINMVMIGAIAKASGFIDLDKLCKCIREKYPKSTDESLKGVAAGFDGVKKGFINADNKYEYISYSKIRRKLDYKNSSIDKINTVFAGSNDLFDEKRCINLRCL